MLCCLGTDKSSQGSTLLLLQFKDSMTLIRCQIIRWFLIFVLLRCQIEAEIRVGRPLCNVMAQHALGALLGEVYWVKRVDTTCFEQFAKSRIVTSPVTGYTSKNKNYGPCSTQRRRRFHPSQIVCKYKLQKVHVKSWSGARAAGERTLFPWQAVFKLSYSWLGNSLPGYF